MNINQENSLFKFIPNDPSKYIVKRVVPKDCKCLHELIETLIPAINILTTFKDVTPDINMVLHETIDNLCEIKRELEDSNEWKKQF